MQTAAPIYQGPAILAAGYRAFFFMAALWALLSVAVWVAVLSGVFGVAESIDMLSWHGHALIFGYGGAVLAGFALTAIPNWTGRDPVRGTELSFLLLPWCVARFAELLLLFGHEVELLRATSEIMFFTLFVVIAAREVIAAKNWRNMKLVVFFGLFATASILANLQRLELLDLPFFAWMVGLVVLILLISLVGGRIIPAFTGNWLKLHGKSSVPTPFGPFDAVTLIVTLVGLVLLIGGWSENALVVAAVLAAFLHVVRLARWSGQHTVSSPIVLVLHLSYLWIPIGFALVAVSTLGLYPIDFNSAIHAWTVGAIGSMTLAVMTRATLGHSGRPLLDGPILTTIYAAINLSAICRVVAVVSPVHYDTLINIAGITWCWAFLMFLVEFGPIHWGTEKRAAAE